MNLGLTDRKALGQTIETWVKASTTDWVREAARLMGVGLGEDTLETISQTVWERTAEESFELDELIDFITDEVQEVVNRNRNPQ